MVIVLGSRQMALGHGLGIRALKCPLVPLQQSTACTDGTDSELSEDVCVTASGVQWQLSGIYHFQIMSTCITSFDPICLQSGSAPLPAPLSKGISWSSICWVREGILTQGYVSERTLHKQTRNFTKIFRWTLLNELFMKNNTALQEWLNEMYFHQLKLQWSNCCWLVLHQEMSFPTHPKATYRHPLPQGVPSPSTQKFLSIHLSSPRSHPSQGSLTWISIPDTCFSLSRMQHQTLNSQAPRTEWRKNRNAQTSLALSPAQNPCIAYASHRPNSGGCVCVCVCTWGRGNQKQHLPSHLLNINGAAKCPSRPRSRGPPQSEGGHSWNGFEDQIISPTPCPGIGLQRRTNLKMWHHQQSCPRRDRDQCKAK